MFARIGTRHGRKALVVLSLVSLASIGACHKNATDPYDPESSELRADRGAVSSASRKGLNLAQNKRAATMIGSTYGSTLDAIGQALATQARK